MTSIEERARSIFMSALMRSSSDWPVFLDESCGAELKLRARVDELLRAHAAMANIPDAESRISLTGFEAPALEGKGELVGSYRLLDQIGEGGFGIVYMAEQFAPIRRKVALKIIKPGMDTRQVVARFEAERQALALMDHPNIARVFDGGATETGRPFFVMELVRGVPITHFCDRNALTIRERLELFVVVCNAVQHAHQKGVIHRDLKPNNVMVTLHDDKSVVKVIDFGIAKAVGQQLTEKTLFTNFSQFIGTPPYMSPEQAHMSGLDIDTRSDIYSLGVLLYELLTGTTPFDKQRLLTVAFDEIRRIIREEDPPKPSTRLSTLRDTATTVSAQRGSDRRQLRELLRRELDWVVMKCLEKDRNRRYESASSLAMDVLRYLKNQPVSACPPSLAYRLHTFARRNKRSLATAGIALVIATIGATMTLWQAVQAASARDEALKSKLKLTESQHIAAVESAGAYKRDLETLGSANRLIQSGRSHYLFGEWAAVQNDLSTAINIRQDHSYAWVARGEFYANLGLWDLAAADFQQAYKLREPDTISLLSQQAVLRFFMGDEDGYRSVCEKLAARTKDADPRSCEEISRVCLLSEKPVLDPDVLVHLAERALGQTGLSVRLVNLGTAHYRAGQYERAIDRLHQARLSRWRYDVVWTDSILAMVHHRLGQNELARKYFDSATQSLDKNLPSAGLRVSVAWWYHVLSELYYREAKQLIDGKPAHEDSGSWTSRGEKLAAIGLNTDALTSYDRAIDLDPKFAPGWEKRAVLRAQLGNWAKAVSDYERFLSLQPDRADVANTLAGILASCPDPNLRQPNRAVELAGKAVSRVPGQAAYWRTLGIARYRAGDLRGSELAMLKALERNPTRHPVDRLILAMALWKSDRKEHAEQIYSDTIASDDWPAETAEEFSLYRKEAAELLGQPEKPPSFRLAHRYDDPSIYTILLEIDPGASWLYERRGNASAMLKQWDQASGDFSRAAESRLNDPILWYDRAAAKLGANDLKGYCELRKEIIARFGKTIIPGVANHVLYICLIIPAEKEESETLVRWGQISQQLTPQNPRARGAAFYRAGNYEIAIRDVSQASKIFPPRAWDFLFIAMAHHKLGHDREAREALEKAEQWVERANRSRSTPSDSPWIHWYESVEVSYLLREAREMILKTKS